MYSISVTDFMKANGLVANPALSSIVTTAIVNSIANDPSTAGVDVGGAYTPTSSPSLLCNCNNNTLDEKGM